MQLHTRLIGFVLVILFALPGAAALAQNGYPTPQEIHINDFANLLPAATEDTLRALLVDLKTDTGTEVVVVTIGSIDGYATDDATIESFATNLFNTWAIGSTQAYDGVLLLVARGDRKVRIEVGSAYENTMNQPMQGVINEFILPAFRENDYEGGIVQGVRGILYQITGEYPTELPAPRPAPVSRPSTGRDSSGSMEWLLWLIVILVMVGSWVWRLMNGESRDSSDDDGDSSYHSSSYRRSSSSWSSSSSRRSSSSSSSRSSSRHGGGRSSGGGASGSW